MDLLWRQVKRPQLGVNRVIVGSFPKSSETSSVLFRTFTRNVGSFSNAPLIIRRLPGLTVRRIARSGILSGAERGGGNEKKKNSDLDFADLQFRDLAGRRHCLGRRHRASLETLDPMAMRSDQFKSQEDRRIITQSQEEEMKKHISLLILAMTVMSLTRRASQLLAAVSLITLFTTPQGLWAQDPAEANRIFSTGLHSNKVVDSLNSFPNVGALIYFAESNDFGIPPGILTRALGPLSMNGSFSWPVIVRPRLPVAFCPLSRHS